MKRKTAKILGGSLMGAGLIAMPFNIAAGVALFASGGFTAGIIGAKLPKDKPEPQK